MRRILRAWSRHGRRLVSGVVLTSVAGGLGTFVKEPSSGRVGIIPHVVPEKPVKACSGRAGTASASDCHLGSVDLWSLAANPAEVIRPSDTAQSREVVVTLDGRNFIVTGQEVTARAEIEYHTSVQGIEFDQPVGVAPASGAPGVLGWTVEILPDENRCLPANSNPDRRSPQTITVTIAQMDGAVPDPPDDTVKATFTVNCPAESTVNAAADLVPENPFPVD